jgi:hypothetical protein
LGNGQETNLKTDLVKVEILDKAKAEEKEKDEGDAAVKAKHLRRVA